MGIERNLIDIIKAMNNPVRTSPPSLQYLGLTQSQIEGIVPVYILGHNKLIGTGNLQDLTSFGEDFITQPLTLTPMEVVSSSVEDNPSGIGAQKININGLNENWERKTHIITLNGQTPVTLDDSGQTISFLKINHTNVIEPSPINSNHTAVGDITIQGLNGGIIYGKIDANTNMELACRGTVPEGFKVYITGWGASTGELPNQGDEISYYLRATSDSTTREVLTNVFIFYDIMHLIDNSDNRIIDPPMEFPARSEIKISAQLSGVGNNTVVTSASFQGWLVPDE